MIIIEDSDKLFIQNPDYVIDYLKKRKVNNLDYYLLIKNNRFGLIKNVKFDVNNIEYNMSHLLGCSQNPGYDIIKANNNLKTLSSNELAIGVVEGDDIVCYDLKGDFVFLYLIENGDGEKVIITKSLSKFIKLFN